MSEHMPCEDLYIYLIEGKVSEGDEIVLGDAFLGNWVEDNSAFLFFSEPSKGLVDTLLRRRKNLTYIDQYHLPYEQWQGGILEPIRFIISGLMRSRGRDLRSQITKFGLEIVREWDHEMTWYTMLLAS